MLTRFVLGLLISAICAGVPLQALAQAPSQPKPDLLDREIDDVVGIYVRVDASQWKPGELESVVMRFAAENSIKAARFVKSESVEDMWILELKKNYWRTAIKPLVVQLRLLKGVRAVQLNVQTETTSTPNDSDFSRQPELLANDWGINGVGSWDVVGAGKPTAIVTVVDTGMIPDPDVYAEAYTGWDFYANKSGAFDAGTWTGPDRSECSNKNITFNTWHGLKMASLIAAKTNSSSGIASIGSWATKGITPKWVPIRIHGCNGSDTQKMARAIRWSVGVEQAGAPAHAWKARVINISISTKDHAECSDDLKLAIATARNAGAIVVVSAGNKDDDASQYSPGNCGGVVVVAGHGTTGAKAADSNWGTNVTLSAPWNVTARSNSDVNSTNWEDDFVTEQVSGTSPAASLVSATLARMFGVNPSLSIDKAVETLKWTSRPHLNSCLGCGVGMLDAAAAIRGAVTPVPTTMELTPSTASLKRGTCLNFKAVVKDQHGGVMTDAPVSWYTNRNLAGYGGPTPYDNYVCGNVPGMGEVRVTAVGYPAVADYTMVGVQY